MSIKKLQEACRKAGVPKDADVEIQTGNPPHHQEGDPPHSFNVEKKFGKWVAEPQWVERDWSFPENSGR
jgi:hypothetical protein